MPMRSGRLEKRTALAIPVRISSNKEPSLIERTTTENVSPLGIRVIVSHYRQLNERVEVDTSDGHLQTQARVVYCLPLADGHFAVGLQFPSEVTYLMKKKFGYSD